MFRVWLRIIQSLTFLPYPKVIILAIRSLSSTNLVVKALRNSPQFDGVAFQIIERLAKIIFLFLLFKATISVQKNQIIIIISTETLLRLLLPLNDKVQSTSGKITDKLPHQLYFPIRGFHRIIQSVGATGGVYNVLFPEFLKIKTPPVAPDEMGFFFLIFFLQAPFLEGPTIS